MQKNWSNSQQSLISTTEQQCAGADEWEKAAHGETTIPSVSAGSAVPPNTQLCLFAVN